jgi:Uncharacterized protein conserved in bacteria (DUF2188)
VADGRHRKAQYRRVPSRHTPPQETSYIQRPEALENLKMCPHTKLSTGELLAGHLMKKDELYVDRHPQGDYAVRRPNSQRATAVKPTQRAAIARATTNSISK